jgi:proline dehydrogenase
MSSLVGQVARAAVAHGVRLHCDAMEIDCCEQTQRLVDEMLPLGTKVSYTLPGRWKRSLSDVDWACERNLPIRVVKGQWADPDDVGRNPRNGYLEVIDRLAGRARNVAVATHDLPLAEEAIRRLRASGTPCSLELLYGLPMRTALRWAEHARVPVRIYVPYGASFLPYALSKVRTNPRMAWWLLRDLVGAN